MHAALKDRTGALIQNHGAVAYGRSLDEASTARSCSMGVEVYSRASALGTPRILSAAELERGEPAPYGRRRMTAGPRWCASARTSSTCSAGR